MTAALLATLVTFVPLSPAQAVEDGEFHDWWGTITISGIDTSRITPDNTYSETHTTRITATLTKSRDGQYSGFAEWRGENDSSWSECYSRGVENGRVTFPEHTNFIDGPVMYDASINAWVKPFPQIWVPVLKTYDANCGNPSGEHWFEDLIGHPWPDSLNLTVPAASVVGIPAPRVTETKNEVLYDSPAPYMENKEVTISYDVSWDTRSFGEVVNPARCARPLPSSNVTKDYLYTTVEGKSRWVLGAAPDLRIATFDVGIRWCTTPDGPGFRGPANVYSLVNANWFLLGVLENVGFTVESRSPKVSMERKTAQAKGRIVLGINPVQVALSVVPVGRLLDNVSTHIDDCFRKIGSGVDPAQATRELADVLHEPTMKIRDKLRRALRNQLDKKLTTIKAIKLANRWTRGFDHAANGMIDHIVSKIALGGLTIDGSAQLTSEAFDMAFGTAEYTLWRPNVIVTIKNSGKTEVENRSDHAPGVEDTWKDKTVT